MSDGTKIEWTDATWNPVTGATPLKRRRSMLVKAAAILIAEIDRLDRLAGQAEAGLDEPDLRTDRTL